MAYSEIAEKKKEDTKKKREYAKVLIDDIVDGKLTGVILFLEGAAVHDPVIDEFYYKPNRVSDI